MNRNTKHRPTDEHVQNEIERLALENAQLHRQIGEAVAVVRDMRISYEADAGLPDIETNMRGALHLNSADQLLESYGMGVRATP